MENSAPTVEEQMKELKEIMRSNNEIIRQQTVNCNTLLEAVRSMTNSVSELKVLMAEYRSPAGYWHHRERESSQSMSGSTSLEDHNVFSDYKVEDIKEFCIDEKKEDNKTLAPMDPLGSQGDDGTKVIAAATVSDPACGTVKRQPLRYQSDYKLTAKGDFNVWLDNVKGEMICEQLRYTVDPKFLPPAHLSQAELNQETQLARGIIVGRLAERYHKVVFDIEDPKLIIDKLREVKRTERNVTDMSIRNELSCMRMKKNENMGQFIEKFDSLIRDYEDYHDAVPLTEQDKRTYFFNAIVDARPEVKGIRISRKGFPDPTYEEWKKYALEVEADDKADKLAAKLNKIQPVNGAKSPRTAIVKCHRCNVHGHHHLTDCPLGNTNLWFCYHCHGVKSHKPQDCYKRHQKQVRRPPYSGNNKSHKFKKNNNGYREPAVEKKMKNPSTRRK